MFTFIKLGRILYSNPLPSSEFRGSEALKKRLSSNRIKLSVFCVTSSLFVTGVISVEFKSSGPSVTDAESSGGLKGRDPVDWEDFSFFESTNTGPKVATFCQSEKKE